MKDDADNKHKILEAALLLFSQRGYEAVGVQELCDVVGITKPTLYYYFGNKLNVLREILLNNYSRFDKALREVAVYQPHPGDYSQDVYPVLIRVIQSYFIFAINNPKFYSMVLGALCLPQAFETRQLTEEFNFRQYEIVEEMFGKMSEAHGNMKGREKRLAWSFIGIINTYVLLGEADAKNAEQLVHDFMHGIFS